MKQTSDKTTKKPDGLLTNFLANHAAVRTTADHDLPWTVGDGAIANGRDFSQVPLNSAESASVHSNLTQSCPFSPQRCPFGGACHTCPPRVHATPAVGIQRKATNNDELTKVPPIVYDVLRSPGQPLDAAMRAFMEPRFGHDFSHVRVHMDVEAAESAHAVSALAYTVGRDVVFAAGQYSPATSTGRQLLAHELTHVVQQIYSSRSLNGISSPVDPSEREAEKAASARFETEPQGLKSTGSVPLLLRQEDPGLPPVGPEIPALGPEPPREDEMPALPTKEKPLHAARTDAFGKECPDTVVLQDKKAIPAYNKRMFDAGFKTYFGLVSNMKVGPKSSYEACITEVLKVEENTCGDKGHMADYDPCTPKKHCMKVGEACGGDVLTDTKFPCSSTTFVDLHRTRRDVSLLEGSGKTECKAKCLQRYGCGGKEIGRFYVTRNFKAGEFNDGMKKVHITVGSIEKEPATK